MFICFVVLKVDVLDVQTEIRAPHTERYFPADYAQNDSNAHHFFDDHDEKDPSRGHINGGSTPMYEQKSEYQKGDIQDSGADIGRDFDVPVCDLIANVDWRYGERQAAHAQYDATDVNTTLHGDTCIGRGRHYERLNK